MKLQNPARFLERETKTPDADGEIRFDPPYDVTGCVVAASCGATVTALRARQSSAPAPHDFAEPGEEYDVAPVAFDHSGELADVTFDVPKGGRPVYLRAAFVALDVRSSDAVTVDFIS